MPIQQEMTGHRHQVKVWASQIEEQALRQLGNVADLPIIHHHVAAMPDAHCGIGATVGATVGSVLATRGAIIPANGGKRSWKGYTRAGHG